MQQALQLAVLAIVAAMLTRVVQAKELALLLPLAACLVVAVVLMDVLQPLLSFARTLQEQTGLESALLAPLWKVLGITLVCRVAAAVCADAGQKALSELVQRGGELLSLAAALPLLQAVLSVLQTLMGG